MYFLADVLYVKESTTKVSKVHTADSEERGSKEFPQTFVPKERIKDAIICITSAAERKASFKL